MEQKKIASIKSLILWIIVLVAVDQGIKLWIANFMMDAEFAIIPSVFAFQTAHNINLGWIWNMLDIMMPLPIAVLISIIAALGIVMVFRYLKFHFYDFKVYEKWLDKFLIFALAGAFCKLIDDIFWGGSLDYIRLFDWFIFDLKDVYLTTVALPIAIFFLVVLEIRICQLPKNERKKERDKYKIWPWIKNGLPIEPSCVQQFP